MSFFIKELIAKPLRKSLSSRVKLSLTALAVSASILLSSSLSISAMASEVEFEASGNIGRV